MGLRAGLTYNFGRKSSEMAPRTVCPAFPRHFSYDLTFFGSWRRKGIEVGDKQYAAPDAYTVLGFNFASMYTSATSSVQACRSTACTTAAPT